MMEPIDMTALRLSDQRRKVLVANVMLQSGQELTRRASGASTIMFLGTWARPALAAAAVLAAVCGTMLARSTPQELTPGIGIAEALGVPSTTTALLASNQAPTMSYMLAAEEGSQ